MASALRTFADNPNLTAAGSAEHGYALRDFLILLRSADVIPAHLDTMTRVLNAYSSANYAPYRDMREAVNYVFNLTYYLLNVPANHAGVAADDHDFRLALRDFVTRNFSADYGNGTTEYLIVNSAFELGRYLDIDTPPAFLTQTRTLVKSLTDQYSLSHGRNVFLKLAEMINYFDRNNCAWYGASVCTAMQDLQDEILPPSQTRVCHDGKLRIKTRNGVGDVDVYVAKTPTWPYPTTPGADSSTSEGNTEAVRIENPGNVWHNIGLHAKNGDYFSGVDIYAYWLLDGQEDIDPSLVDPEEPEEPGENPDPIPDVSHLPECANDYALSSDCKITNLGASGSGFKTFHFQVLARALPVKVTIRSFGGTGDADLFYKLPGDGYPNPTTFDQSSTFAGNNETIAVTAPLAGYHNLALYPKAGGSFEGVTVAVFFEEDEPEEPEPGFDPNTLPECASTYILTAGCKISGQTRTGNGRAYLTFQIPANTPRAVVKTFGGTGDVDMFGKFSPDYPTPENHEHASTNVGNDETITLDDPTAGLWYNVTLQAKSTGFSDVGVYLTFPAEDPEEPEPIDPSTLPECTASDARQLDPGCKRSGAEQANATWFTWFMTYVPAGANSLTIKTFGGTGDAGDAGVWPNATTYAHLSDNAGNEESVTITTPASGWYYIGLRPKSASFSGVSIYITRD